MGQMKDRRLELDERFRAIPGIMDHVYFEPPASVKMKYPAIRYQRERIDVQHADNAPYLSNTGYLVTVIDKNPDSEVVEAIRQFPRCRYNRHYASDNLSHDVFIIYA